jgi:hypothetical protein
MEENKQSFLLFILFSLFICSCDLFTGPKDDLFKKISDDVDWANAPKLTVSVAYPPEWGNSPQAGDGKCGDTRLGYEFGVEFTPLSGYGFEKWLAFKTADYADLDKNAGAAKVEDSALNGNGVTITESTSDTGAKTARVTINITGPVTLVPWCGNRPRLAQQTNPPLNPILTPFPFAQNVNIWFTMPVKASTLTRDNIRITGIYASGNNRGQPFNEDGDLSGYFKLEIPAGSDRRLNLIPIPQTASGRALHAISGTVGPNIESSNGVTMAQAETISYQTDTREAQKVYRANEVSANRSAASGYWTDADYSNPDKDRRFKQTDKNTVYIRFSVDPPSGEGIPPAPNRIRIVESRAYDLRGFNASGTKEKEYDYPGTGVTLLNGVFTIEHTLQTGDVDGTSGIIQLLVLPLNEGTPAIAAMPENEALSEGRYVTVVMDNAAPDAPDLRPGFPENSWSSREGNVYTYGKDVPMTLTLAGLANIADNGEVGGIPASRAYSLPWTMEEPQKLSWYAQIGNDERMLNSGWQPVYQDNGINNTWTLANLSGLGEADDYPIRVKFKDSLGNESGWKETSLRVKYSTATIETVSNIRAECNPTGNQITVSWDEAGTGWTSATGTYPYPEVVITTYRASAAGDIEESTATVTRNRNVKTYSFAAPKINDTAVLDGTAVSGVYGYKISVITHNIAGNPETAPVWIYNIPGMSVTQNSNILLNNGNIRTALTASGSSGKNFILTEDINLTPVPTYPAWTPVGTNAARFQGKFYGNGHTITFNTGFANAAYTGLFGYAMDAEIRDLTVDYAVDITAGASATNMGGVAGRIDGSAVIRNVTVRGTKISISSASAIYAGSIAGYMQSTAAIENCFTNIELSATATGSGILHAGGIVGYIRYNSSVSVPICVNLVDILMKYMMMYGKINEWEVGKSGLSS